MHDIPWYWVLGFLAIVLSTRLRVVAENERYGVFALGRFLGFKGPGVIFKGKGAAEWKRVRAGERGTLINGNTVRVAAGDLPALIDGNPKVGVFVRVTGFERQRVLVATDSDQRRSIKCARCGHENEIDSRG